MMLIGIGAVALIWHPGSPFEAWIPWPSLRRLLTGTIFASGATLVVYSRLGQRSGAHINPAVTLAFWTLGKISSRDALAYVGAQILGALAGVAAVALLLGEKAMGVHLGMTTPAEGLHWIWAFTAEALITFLLVFLILQCVGRPRLAPYTGYFAGSLVALLVCAEAQYTGTSLNPARSLAPAILMGYSSDLAMWFPMAPMHQWLYLVAPPLGALVAVGLSRRLERTRPACAKLYHTENYPCIFADCGYHLVRAGETVLREGEESQRAFVVERGELEVRRRDTAGKDVVLGRLGPRDWVGEMGLLLQQPRSATVVAITDAQLRPITRENFARVIAEDPEVSLRVLRQLAERLYEADRRITL
jgi:aquaporin Z